MIKLGVTDLSFHRATAAIVAVVLETLGHKVQRSYALHEENFDRLRRGDIDMLASAWLPSSHGIYKAHVEEIVACREFGLHYEPYTIWGVPDYVPAEDVSTIADLLKPAVRTKMNSVIQGIGPGAGITRFSIIMMNEYGLKDAGYEFRTGTQQDCFEAFERAVAEKRWVVVPLWHPQFLHARYHIRELNEPKGLLGGVDRAVLLAREDRLGPLAPHALRVLDRIRLSNAIVSGLDYAINREGKTEDAAARVWIDTNKDIFSSWFSREDAKAAK